MKIEEGILKGQDCFSGVESSIPGDGSGGMVCLLISNTFITYSLLYGNVLSINSYVYLWIKVMDWCNIVE